MAPPSKPTPKSLSASLWVLESLAYDIQCCLEKGGVILEGAPDDGPLAGKEAETAHRIEEFSKALIPAAFGVDAQTFRWLALASSIESALENLDVLESVGSERVAREARQRGLTDADSRLKIAIELDVESYLLQSSDLKLMGYDIEGGPEFIDLLWEWRTSGRAKWRKFSALCRKLGVKTPSVDVMKRLLRKYRSFTIYQDPPVHFPWKRKGGFLESAEDSSNPRSQEKPRRTR